MIHMSISYINFIRLLYLTYSKYIVYFLTIVVYFRFLLYNYEVSIKK